jgi:hypothetical protein
LPDGSKSLISADWTDFAPTVPPLGAIAAKQTATFGSLEALLHASSVVNALLGRLAQPESEEANSTVNKEGVLATKPESLRPSAQGTFRALKGIVKLQPIRHWLSQRVIAHVFICYLAYLLLALLKYRLKPTGLSPEEALDELSTMYKVYLQDSKQVHRLSRVVTLTRRQETILKAINPALLKAQN